ncbi:hypothetical protein RND71_007033 [Anisodus tanguticus]|uniref:Uncharacterized protein n=1 Tax=Anisodus tanguticus TaxID=243964 RepID=A0AAE1VSQ6_9SOLA|nr:hypothetical protein RND71_007033 [Anisodus tanguticus]
MNVPSVVHATLDFRPHTHSDREKKKLKWQQENLIELVRSLKHVENLTLGTWCVEAQSKPQPKNLQAHPDRPNTQARFLLSVNYQTST